MHPQDPTMTNSGAVQASQSPIRWNGMNEQAMIAMYVRTRFQLSRELELCEVGSGWTSRADGLAIAGIRCAFEEAAVSGEAITVQSVRSRMSLATIEASFLKAVAQPGALAPELYPTTTVQYLLSFGLPGYSVSAIISGQEQKPGALAVIEDHMGYFIDIAAPVLARLEQIEALGRASQLRQAA